MQSQKATDEGEEPRKAADREKTCMMCSRV